MSVKLMAKAKMDERGRILITFEERKRLGLKAGTEFELFSENGALILRPIISEPSHVDDRSRKWGKVAFLDAGEATFGE